MTRTGQIFRALIVAGTLETIRRKDLYVVLILTVLMMAAAWAFGFFGVRGLEVFIKDVTFTAIGGFSTVLTVLLAARQLPEEIQRKTIYPLLARPITRWELLIGKWLTAFLTATLGFLLLATVGRALLAVFGIGVGAIFWQYLLLKTVGIAWLSALTIALSLYMTTGATVTLSLILAFGSGFFNRFILQAQAEFGQAPWWLNWLFGLLPHYDFFDLSKKVTYDWSPVPFWVVIALIAYGLISSLIWLTIGWWRFRKQVV